MKNRAETHTASPEELIATIQKLMDEVEAIIARPAEAVSETGARFSELRERLAETTERLNDKLNGAYKTAKRTVVDTARKTDDTIRSHPYPSLGLALGVGVIVGMFLRRSD